MKSLLRQPQQPHSGYVAVAIFLLAYAATLALVIAPAHVKSAMDVILVWPFG